MYFFCLSNVSSCVCAVHIKLWDEYAKRNTVSWRLCSLNCDYRFVCHMIKYISSGYWSWLSQTRVRGSLRVFSPFTRIFLEEKTILHTKWNLSYIQLMFEVSGWVSKCKSMAILIVRYSCVIWHLVNESLGCIGCNDWHMLRNVCQSLLWYI